MDEISIVIIGGGAVGCAVAYELSKNTNKDILVIERNHSILSENQSSRNSGVVHAGIYYPNKKGPLKAKLCVEGNAMMYEFCKEHDVPCEMVGKLIVATSEREEEYMNDVHRIATENKVPNMEIIGPDRIKELEPNVSGTKALHVPTSGIVEPTKLVERLWKLSEGNGAMFLEGTEVIGLEKDGEGDDHTFIVTTTSGGREEKFRAKTVINSAGLYSDDIAKMIDPESPYVMDPVKGEWGKFYKTKRENLDMNGMNVYPVPYGFDKDGNKVNVPFAEFKKLFDAGEVFKSVGIHLTPIFDLIDEKYVVGTTITMGPAYVAGVDKEDYKQIHDEKYYYDAAKGFFPGLELDDISLHQTGIRAKLRDHYDFIIERCPKATNMINLVGIDSPGLTCCLSIAKMVDKIYHG